MVILSARDVGIEPTSQPLEGRMLPLHQSRIVICIIYLKNTFAKKFGGSEKRSPYLTI